jgi:hypothetical protein
MSQLPLDSDRKILTSPVLNGATLDGDTICTPGGAPMFERYSVDSLDDDEEGDAVDAWVEDLDAAQDAGEPTPEAYLSYMGRVTDVEPTEPPSHTESRAVYEAWAIASDGGAQTQAWVDEGSGLTAGQAKGRILLSCLQHGAILTTGQHGLVTQFEAIGEPIEPLVLGGATHL